MKLIIPIFSHDDCFRAMLEEIEGIGIEVVLLSCSVELLEGQHGYDIHVSVDILTDDLTMEIVDQCNNVKALPTRAATPTAVASTVPH